MPDPQHKETKAKAANSKDPSVDRDMVRELSTALRAGFLKAELQARDELEAGIAKLPSLSSHDRIGLSLTASVPRQFCAEKFAPLLSPDDPKFAADLKQRLDPVGDSLCTMSKLMMLRVKDPEKNQATLDSYIKKTWAGAKPTVDAALNTPEAKELLKRNSNPPAKK